MSTERPVRSHGFPSDAQPQVARNLRRACERIGDGGNHERGPAARIAGDVYGGTGGARRLICTEHDAAMRCPADGDRQVAWPRHLDVERFEQSRFGTGEPACDEHQLRGNSQIPCS